MEISVYMSKMFVNENTPIFKIEKIEKEKFFKTTRSGEKEQKERHFSREDPMSKTTLNELYAEGWKLVSTERPQQFWMMFFLERDN